MKSKNNNIENDERSLIAQVSIGNHQAFSIFYEKYFDEIYYHIFSKISDEEITKDLAQDIFFKIWEKRELLQDISNVRGYLYTVARNKVLDYIAHNKIIDKYYESFLHTYNIEEGTDFLVRSKEIEQIIKAEIDALPSKMREIFELSRHEYLTYKEIAEQLGISEKTVKTQINNALHRIKKNLNPYFYFFLI